MYGLQPTQPVRGKKGKGQELPPVADTIPALMAPGEAVLPSDTVQALGPANVQGLIDATHKPVTPVADPRQRVNGEKPQLFFANGGLTPEKDELASKIPTGGIKAPASTGEMPGEFARNAYNTLNAMGGLSAPVQAPARIPQTLKAIDNANDVRVSLHVPGQLAAPAAAAPKALEYSGTASVPAVRGAGRTADAGADWVSGMGSNAQAARPVNGQLPPKNMGPVQEVGVPLLPGPAQAASAAPEAAAAAAARRAMPSADVVQANAARVGQVSGGLSAVDQSGQMPVPAQGGAAGASAAPAAPPADARSMYFDDRAKDMSARWNSGDYAGAIGSGLRTAGEGLGMMAIGAVDNMVSPWASAAGGLWDGLAGNQPGAAQAAQPPAPEAKPATAAAAPTVAQKPAPAAASAPAAATPAEPGAQKIADGVYRVGNSYSDSAAGAASMNQRGGISAQNEAAARGLAAQSQAESMARVQAGYGLQQLAPQITIAAPPTSSGLDQQTKNLLSTVLTPHMGSQNKQLTIGQMNAARGILEGAHDRGLRGYQSQLQAQTQLQQTGMQNDGAMARESLQQSGANHRDANRAAIDGQRLGLERSRVEGDQKEQQARVKEMERQSAIFDELANPETSKERADFLTQQLQTLRGKAEQNRYTVVPGGQEWDDKAMAMRTVPARVFNNQTGRFEEQSAPAKANPAAATSTGPATPKNKAEYDALPKGAQYIKDGITKIKE